MEFSKKATEVKVHHLSFAKLLWVVLVGCSSPTLASESIRWVSFDFPPFEIIEGPDAGTGITDEMRKFSQLGLPNYEHQVPTIVNQARLKRLFKEGLSCYPGIIPNKEGEPFLYYSIPYSMDYPVLLVTTKKKHQTLFNNATSLSLEQSLKDLAATLTVPSRTLGPVIDDIIEKNKGNKNLSIRMSMDHAGKTFEMLLKGRTDYVIAYNSEAVYWGQNGETNQLVFMDISELKGQFVLGSVGCSKSPKGREVIKKLNTYFAKNRNDKAYIKRAFLDWMPEQYHMEFLAQYKKLVLTDDSSNVAEPPTIQ